MSERAKVELAIQECLDRARIYDKRGCPRLAAGMRTRARMLRQQMIALRRLQGGPLPGIAAHNGIDGER
jgi:hypothetical protein